MPVVLIVARNGGCNDRGDIICYRTCFPERGWQMTALEPNPALEIVGYANGSLVCQTALGLDNV